MQGWIRRVDSLRNRGYNPIHAGETKAKKADGSSVAESVYCCFFWSVAGGDRSGLGNQSLC